MTIDANGEVNAINPACERYFEVVSSMACGSHATKFISGQVIEPLLLQASTFHSGATSLDTSMAETRESVGYRSDGSEFPILVAAFCSTIEGHVCVTLIIDDISDRFESARESEQAFVEMKTLTNLAPVGILQLAVDWTCQYANDMWYELSDLTTEESLGEGWIDAIHAEDVHSTLNQLRDSVCKNTPFKKELRLQQPLGGITWVSMSATSTTDEQHKLTGFLVVFTDITEKHHAAERLKQIAHHDTLTGLLNRLYFRDKLSEVLNSDKYYKKVALLVIDLDGFKAVNDGLGHDAGDCVLREAANRLQSAVRDTDIVARLGGDEFTVTLSRLASDACPELVADKIIESLQKPIPVADVEVEISASIGIAVAPDGDIEIDDFIKQADIALYAAKESGKSKYVLYSDALSHEQQKQAEMNKVIREAVEKSLFRMVYQPQMDLAGQRILGFEALLRLPDEFGMEYMPEHVVKTLESSGLIATVGAWLIKTACDDFMDWRQAGLLDGNCKISVNVSARQLANPGLLDCIDSAVHTSGIDYSDLIVELTESAFIDKTEATLETIQAIKARGIEISLDDFGTGYSSLSYMSRLPIDHLKIDRSFVKDLCSSKQRLAIVRAILGMARAMGLSVIAEGVENNDTVNLLAAEGCDAYQGFHFSKPKTAADIKTFLVESHPIKLIQYSKFYDLGAITPVGSAKNNALVSFEPEQAKIEALA
jgi:diguanylate cyclase (GGDEF)-like protein/PAS domain S-box-containing protein